MKKKILLIDNDSTYLYIAKQLLKKHAIVGETVTAENGSEALELLKTYHEKGELPHVIISDIEMPVMCGITFLKELERLKLVDHTFTKIVLNSIYTKYAKMEWSVANHTIPYFQKPLLHEHIHTILSD
ncbi:response regulator [Pontibacter pudoricolor]|uniref:response regulator n=1 Tax=Pontibacter pudoricolor TaxID=2694930 RepID=UPI0013916979|nr:response regulator [Pontibacter pudoricolor]